MSPRRSHLRSRPAARAFTLLELLVVMGILLILAVLTTISVGKVTRDARLASATNTVVAALGNARAVAIRDNTYVLVTFRVAPDRRARALPRTPTVIQIVTARWTGEVVQPNTPLPPGVEMPSTGDVYGERFLPVPGVPTRDLPAGIYVAGPGFFRVVDTSVGGSDRYWFTQPTFAGVANYGATPPTFVPDRAQTEVGNAIGVMFGPDGRVASRTQSSVLEVDATPSNGSGSSDQNAWVKPFLDVDNDGFPKRGTSQFGTYPPLQNVSFFYYDEPTDEIFVDLVPYLAVFNMAEARELFSTAAWKGPNIGGIDSPTQPASPPQRVRDLSDFIDEQSDRITFNRFTGVAGVVPK